jgi:pilus assembly protein HofO
MLMLAERWCDLSPRVRLGSWLSMLLILVVVSGFSGCSPLKPMPPAPLTAQWRKMMPLRAATSAISGSPTKPFSVLDFEDADRHLVSWQPVGASGELALEADWHTIPPLFALLAETGRAVRGFSIQPERQRLRLTLQLEAIADD